MHEQTIEICGKKVAFRSSATIPPTIEEWPDQFDMFSIYGVLPQILELWGQNMMTEVQAKKS